MLYEQVLHSDFNSMDNYPSNILIPKVPLSRNNPLRLQIQKRNNKNDEQSPFPDGDRFFSGDLNLDNGDFVATPPTGTTSEIFWDSLHYSPVEKKSMNQTPVKSQRMIKTEGFSIVSETPVSYQDFDFKSESSNDIQPSNTLSTNTQASNAQSSNVPEIPNNNTIDNFKDSEYSQDDEYVEDQSYSKKRKFDEIDDNTDDFEVKRKKKRSRSTGHNTGSWTDEEHRLFLEGLEKFGRSKWREISEYVGTRSRIQVASHSQKFFAKTEHKGSSRGMRTKKSYDY